MTRWLPHPLLATAIFAMWLLLNQSVSPGQLILGGVVGVLGSRLLARLGPDPGIVRSLKPVPRLLAAVLADVVRSNVAVATIVLSPRRRDRVSGFVSLPLDLRNRHGLAVLACIVTATPGTLWIQYDRKSDRLLIHVLDLVDEEHWIELIKRRYERPLLEIFG